MSAWLLLDGGPDVAEAAMAALPSLAARRRHIAAYVAVAASLDRAAAARAVLNGGDRQSRTAVAAVLSVDPGNAAGLLDGLLNDADLSVRVAAGAGVDQAAGAEAWSCSFCASRNKVSEPDCDGCDFGARPAPERTGRS